ncbi:MAG: sugar transporter [Silicimonas sp.]|nr:sugar transporter [Silicimonas sp.]
MALPEESAGPAQLTYLRPPAEAARPRARHGRLLGSFALVVLAPFAFAMAYLLVLAEDQYASTVGFSVIREEVGSPVELFGGIADVARRGSSDSDILYEYLRSQELVAALEAQIGLSALLARPRFDPVFAYDPAGTIEDLRDHWQRVARIRYDGATQLIELRVLAFTPEDARRIAEAALAESARLVDRLSAIAREDTIAFAKSELARAVERLKAAREAITAYRSRTQIVDPSADLEGQMGLLSTLQQQLAEALIAADLLRESTRVSDPRITQAERRIAVIEARIEEERGKLGVGGAGGAGEDYATLLAEYERLSVDREFAEQAYVAALASYDQALAEARRKSRYLAAYINPTLAEASKFPRVVELLAILAFGLTGLWALGVLIYYSIRDRR